MGSWLSSRSDKPVLHNIYLCIRDKDGQKRYTAIQWPNTFSEFVRSVSVYYPNINEGTQFGFHDGHYPDTAHPRLIWVDGEASYRALVPLSYLSSPNVQLYYVSLADLIRV